MINMISLTKGSFTIDEGKIAISRGLYDRLIIHVEINGKSLTFACIEEGKIKMNEYSSLFQEEMKGN